MRIYVLFSRFVRIVLLCSPYLLLINCKRLAQAFFILLLLSFLPLHHLHQLVWLERRNSLSRALSPLSCPYFCLVDLSYEEFPRLRHNSEACCAGGGQSVIGWVRVSAAQSHLIWVGSLSVFTRRPGGHGPIWPPRFRRSDLNFPIQVRGKPTTTLF